MKRANRSKVTKKTKVAVAPTVPKSLFANDVLMMTRVDLVAYSDKCRMLPSKFTSDSLKRSLGDGYFGIGNFVTS